MFKYFRHHFYNQLMLLNTIIVCASTLIFGLLASTSLNKIQVLLQLRTYDDTLIRLHETYLSKQEEYIDLMFTFYEEPENYQSISQLIDADIQSLDELSVFDIQSISRTLKRLCNKDEDIVAVYIFRQKGLHLYEYRKESNVIRELSGDSLFYDSMSNKDYKRSSYGITNINQGNDETEFVYAYSIGGNLSSASINMVDKPGNILIAYNEIELRMNLINKGLHHDSRFIICMDNGELIFDTKKDDITGDGFNYIDFDLSRISEPSGEINLDKQSYYYSYIRDSKRGYLSLYLIPREAVLSGKRSAMITLWGEALIFVGLSILIFVAFTRWSTKRFNLLEQGMTQIGLNNLSFRIPQPNRQDEFASITRRFNQMCDDLEESINMKYRYELQQKKAEIYALQTSINPHFLYNTLEVIRNQLSMGNNTDASEMILLLSRLYRSQMKGKMFVSLREEINNCNLYIDLYGLRHLDKLQLINRIRPEVLRFGVPKHSIQPLIENFVVHGLQEDNNIILLDAGIEKDIITITVQDNGKNLDAEKLKKIEKDLYSSENNTSQGSGLKNIHERLKIVYGNDMGIKIFTGDSGWGFKIELRIRALSTNTLEERYRRAFGEGKNEKTMHS